jgi:signal transduction histidine kinase/ActR/RegA family two-component response regulator
MKPSFKFFIVFAGALAMVLAGLAVTLYGESLYRNGQGREITVQADILGASVAGALAFDDDASAQEYVNALRSNPAVEAAGAYDDSGRLAASFVRSGALPQAIAPAPARFADGRVTVSRAVSQGGAQLGVVYLRAVTEPLMQRLSRYAVLMLLVFMAALVLIALGAAQAVLARANRELAGRAADLAEANRLLKEQIEERERAEEALRQSQKMEAIGRITGGVAHDFNNLLMVASSGLDLMDRAKDPEKRQALKDGVRQALDRGAGLTRHLLAFSRRTPMKSEVVDLRSHIDGMRALLDRSLREDITVERKVAADLWPVEIDPNQFELALLNLAVNARDAMPAGGRITICAENCELDQGRLKGDHVCLKLSDTGEGIPPSVLPHVFEPFFTTKDVGKGTGLGLSQVYGFARSSGGDVSIDNNPDGGVTVSLFIPRSQRSPDEAAAASDHRAVPAGDGRRVLLVEDDDGVAVMVTQMLAELGYRTVRAATASAALAILKTTPQFDVVFSDLVMPGGMDGMGLAAEIARQRPDLPILLTTGFSEAAAAATADGLRLLSKPYTIDALGAALAETLEAGKAVQG